MMSVSVPGDLERLICEGGKVKPGLSWGAQNLEMPEPWDTCQRELLTGSGINPRGRSVLRFGSLLYIVMLNIGPQGLIAPRYKDICTYNVNLIFN